MENYHHQGSSSSASHQRGGSGTSDGGGNNNNYYYNNNSSTAGGGGGDRGNVLAGELNHGVEFTRKLQMMLNDPNYSPNSHETEYLLQGIIESFNRAISIVQNPSISISNTSNQLFTAALSPAGSAGGGGGSPISEDSIDQNHVVNHRHSAKYPTKRKSVTKWVTRVQVTQETGFDVPINDDGFNWRKYGQKEIHGATHQRAYYRCTMKAQGCEAKKLVQRSDEDPSIFTVTYRGNHTCNNNSLSSSNSSATLMTLQQHQHQTPPAPAPLLDAPDANLISFNMNINNNNNNNAANSVSGSVLIFRGTPQRTSSNDSTQHNININNNQGHQQQQIPDHHHQPVINHHVVQLGGQSTSTAAVIVDGSSTSAAADNHYADLQDFPFDHFDEDYYPSILYH